jgi:hypothetical protein
MKWKFCLFYGARLTVEYEWNLSAEDAQQQQQHNILVLNFMIKAKYRKICWACQGEK